MRRMIAVLGVAFLLMEPVAGAPGTMQTAAERPEDAAAIRDHIDSIFRAYIARDREQVRATHAEGWRGFLRPSRSIVKGIEGYMKAAEAALSGPYGLSAYEFVEFDVVFYGETGVVSYVAELVSDRGGMRPRIRVLDVYLRVDGHWAQVASQTAHHPDTLEAQRTCPEAAAQEPGR